MSGYSGSPKDPSPAPGSFRGWQRSACLAGVALLFLFALFLVVNVVLGLLGVH